MHWKLIVCKMSFGLSIVLTFARVYPKPDKLPELLVLDSDIKLYTLLALAIVFLVLLFMDRNNTDRALKF
jgi:hypothetical protein